MDKPADHKRIYYIVNAISGYRLLAVPLLVFLVAAKRMDAFKWLLALSFFTDAVDGWLARKYKVTSVWGSKLDSLADDGTIVAALAGIVLYRPEFLRQEILLIAGMLALYLTETILALSRYGRISGFHTYAAKMAAICQGVFLLLFFFLPQPVYWLFYTAAFVTIADLLEEIILVILLPEWESDSKGLYWVLRRKNPHTPKG